MGEVYRAKDSRDGSILAIKIILPQLSKDQEFRRRFERESDLAASISDPHVVRVREAGETEEGVLYLAMDLIDGTDLQSLIDAGGQVSAEKAMPLLRDTAAGLDAIHAGGLIHRDLKPGNILVRLTRPPQAFVSDFGLARSIESSTALTSQGKFFGSLDYASPEQISGKRLDARSDVYSLGCVFFHALVGDPPFGGRDTAAKLYAQVHEPPPSIGGRGIPDIDLLDGVFERALEKDPRLRYPSAGDFAAAFEMALKGEANTRKEQSVGVGDAAPLNVRETRVIPLSNQSRRRWLIGVSALLVICLVGASSFLLLRDSGSKDGLEARSSPSQPDSPDGVDESAASPESGGVDEGASTSNLFGAPVEGETASIVDRGGTTETVIADYCSPTGDFCHSVFDRSGDVILSMGQLSFGAGKYQICVSSPSQERQCEAFQWARAGQGYFEGEVNLEESFDIPEPGTYRAAWSTAGFQVGTPLSFQMLPVVPGGLASPGEVSGYIAQLGSFDTEVEAQAFRSNLNSEGFPTSILRSSQFDELEPGYWVVFSGPFETQAQADESAASSGIDEAFGRPIG